MKRSKRIFDVVCSACGMLVLSPLLAVIALLIVCDDGGPILYRQERIGCKGRPFVMLKFRSMKSESEQTMALTVGDDPRITRVGHWLRTSKLDELPQLVHVFCGEMSVVGPRPEVPKYVFQYPETLCSVLDLTPGITDPASLKYRDESHWLGRVAEPERFYVEKIMVDKIRINLAYHAHANVWTDMGVIVKTLMVVFTTTHHVEPMWMQGEMGDVHIE